MGATYIYLLSEFIIHLSVRFERLYTTLWGVEIRYWMDLCFDFVFLYHVLWSCFYLYFKVLKKDHF